MNGARREKEVFNQDRKQAIASFGCGMKGEDSGVDFSDCQGQVVGSPGSRHPSQLLANPKRHAEARRMGLPGMLACEVRSALPLRPYSTRHRSGRLKGIRLVNRRSTALAVRPALAWRAESGAAEARKNCCWSYSCRRTSCKAGK